ncbi:MAG TPA: transcriptional regulator [Prevotella sp.]|jgi:DNA-binding transcriptional MerR regulator|nr:transcriptional regulator [Prevotella sp.]
MALNPNKKVKLYYSIKEVAEMMGINESTLRFWEKEFPHLKPKTAGNGIRQYTEKDIEQLRVIYSLIKVRGFKIAAARKYLNENRSGADKSSEVLDTLISVRDQLVTLKKMIDTLV